MKLSFSPEPTATAVSDDPSRLLPAAPSALAPG